VVGQRRLQKAAQGVPFLPIRLLMSSNKRGVGRYDPSRRTFGRTLFTHRLHGIETPVAGSGKRSIIKRRVRTMAAAEGDGMKRKAEGRRHMRLGPEKNVGVWLANPDPKRNTAEALLEEAFGSRKFLCRHGLDGATNTTIPIRYSVNGKHSRTAAGFGNRALYPPKKKLTWTAASVASSPDHHGRLCGRCRGCDPKKALFWAPPANCVKHLATVHNPGRRR
jgi:hypothetical protein